MGALPATFTRATLRVAVADTLRSEIDEGFLTPGTHLAEVELSHRLGVSRATLREALRELQQEGLLSQDHRGRVSVTVLDDQDVRDLFEVRLSLEQLAVRRICRLPDRSAATEHLREKLTAMVGASSVTDGVRADLRFHESICAASGNTTLLRNWQSLSGRIHLTMVSSGIAPARADDTVRRHGPIVDAIESGDVDAAQLFLERHMDDAIEYVLAHRARTG